MPRSALTDGPPAAAGRADDIGIASSLSAGWATLWRYPGPLLIGSLAYSAVAFAFVQILEESPFSTEDTAGSSVAEEAAYGPYAWLALALLALGLAYLGAGWIRLRLRAAAGDDATLADLFMGWPYVGRVLLLYLVFGLGIVALVLVFVFGLLGVGSIGWIFEWGVFLYLLAWLMISYVKYRLFFAVWLVVDSNLGVWEALRESWRLTAGKVLVLLVLEFLLGVLMFFSVFVFIIGGLVGLAWAETVWAEVYATLAWEEVPGDGGEGDPLPPAKGLEIIPQ